MQDFCISKGGDCAVCPHSLSAHFLDLLDELEQKKNALGFIADHIKDPQAEAAVALVEQDLESMLEKSRSFLHP